ncbi:MAG: hypothetical protein ACLP1Y_13540 [Candidatus Acidiferrales bacterium]
MTDTPAAPEASAPATPAPPQAAPLPELALAAPPKIKVRKHKQRSCDERDAKGKLCAGHLKRWYDYPKEIEAIIGPNAEIYRCEFCRTLYRPDPMQMPNSYTLRY